MSRDVDVVVTYLELVAPAGLRELPAEFELRHEQSPESIEIAGAMYRSVGSDFFWLDRAAWTSEQWRVEVDRDGVEVWTARVDNEIAGYFQLHVESDSVELKYFGLRRPFIGRGLGAALLSSAVRRARSIGGGHVTLNTCSLDHPAALRNYLASGFRVVRTEVQRRSLPE